jgi:uncharacterized OsmC-like protein
MSLNPVEWKLLPNGDVLMKFNHDLLPDTTVSPTSVPKNKRGGVARALLSASALSCMAGSLTSMLKSRDVPVKEINGNASVQMGKDEKNRSVIESMTINLSVDVEEDHLAVLDRCIGYLEDGCLVTRGLKSGIKVSTNINISAEIPHNR